MTYEPDSPSATRDGPKITIVKTVRCFGCVHLMSEDYAFEDGNSDDSGTHYICKLTPPSALVLGRDEQLYAPQIDPDKTPSWCMRLEPSWHSAEPKEK